MASAPASVASTSAATNATASTTALSSGSNPTQLTSSQPSPNTNSSSSPSTNNTASPKSDSSDSKSGFGKFLNAAINILIGLAGIAIGIVFGIYSERKTTLAYDATLWRDCHDIIEMQHTTTCQRLLHAGFDALSPRDVITPPHAKPAALHNSTSLQGFLGGVKDFEAKYIITVVTWPIILVIDTVLRIASFTLPPICIGLVITSQPSRWRFKAVAVIAILAAECLFWQLSRSRISTFLKSVTSTGLSLIFITGFRLPKNEDQKDLFVYAALIYFGCTWIYMDAFAIIPHQIAVEMFAKGLPGVFTLLCFLPLLYWILSQRVIWIGRLRRLNS